jgi:hypothetical protein
VGAIGRGAGRRAVTSERRRGRSARPASNAVRRGRGRSTWTWPANTAVRKRRGRSTWTWPASTAERRRRGRNTWKWPANTAVRRRRGRSTWTWPASTAVRGGSCWRAVRRRGCRSARLGRAWAWAWSWATVAVSLSRRRRGGLQPRHAGAVAAKRRWDRRAWPDRTAVRRRSVRWRSRAVRRRSGANHCVGRGHGPGGLGDEVQRDAQHHVELDAPGDGGVPGLAGGCVPARLLIGGGAASCRTRRPWWRRRPGLHIEESGVGGLPRERAEPGHGLLDVGGASVEARQKAVVVFVLDVVESVVRRRGRGLAGLERGHHGQLGKAARARRAALREVRQRARAEVGEMRLVARLVEVVAGGGVTGEVPRGRCGGDEEEEEEVREGSCHRHGTHRARWMRRQ